MDVARIRLLLRIIAMVSLTGLLTTALLYLLLTRLEDKVGASWAASISLLAAAATVTAVTSLSLIDQRAEPTPPASRRANR